MTEAERKELDALDAKWTRCTDEMPFDLYRRWCDLQVKRRDAPAPIYQQRRTIMGEDVKPCPFVHEVERGPSVELDDEEWDCVSVRCGDCAAMGPVMMLQDYPDHDAATKAAIAAWNTRVSHKEGE